MNVLLPALTLASGALLLTAAALPTQTRPQAPASRTSKLSQLHPTPATPLVASIARGKRVYQNVCLTCHQEDGNGVANLNPPLTKTSYVLGDKNRLIGIVLRGMKGPTDINGDTYRQNMPAQAYLTDLNVADVLTYVRNSFGNKASAISADEVHAQREVAVK